MSALERWTFIGGFYIFCLLVTIPGVLVGGSQYWWEIPTAVLLSALPPALMWLSGRRGQS